ncbi:MAG: hypothetical protein RLZZ502_1545, partial [Pseudomonadota bacterium]
KVQVIGISFDREEAIYRYLNEVKINYLNLEADMGKIDLIKNLGAEKIALPFSVLLDSSMKIVYVESGKVDLTRLKTRINRPSSSQ